MSKIMSADESAELIKKGDTVALSGSGGGLMEARAVMESIETRFLNTGFPNNLTLVHGSGIGDRKKEGTNRFAHEKLVKRVIGGHWGWSPRMQQLANDNKIEAYNLPQGVMTQQYREIAAKRPGLITKIGLKTFIDPRISGGKLNSITKEDLVSLIEIDGNEWLHYKTYGIDVAIIRGTVADTLGNIAVDHEPAVLEILALAQAARNSGGFIICQVKYIASEGTLDPRKVKVPGILIDAIVVDSEQKQTAEDEFNPSFTGEFKIPLDKLVLMKFNERKIISRRAAMELMKDGVINLGFGIPDGVALIAAEEGISELFTLTIEQGIIGGIPASGDIFGVATNPLAIIDEPAQFDFYSGNGLDLTCLGMAQVDENGNVNVSKFGQIIAGCGGFIDISQTAKKVVFCGTFSSGGLKVEIQDGELKIINEGKHFKFIKNVDQITFSGDYAREEGKKVLYVTERAVFELIPEGLLLKEVAPGINIQKDIIDKMGFKPLMPQEPIIMDTRIFYKEKMGLSLEN